MGMGLACEVVGLRWSRQWFWTEDLHGFGKGFSFDHGEKVDGIALDLTGFPDPVTIADNQVAIGVDPEVLAVHFMQGEATVLEQWGEGEFAGVTDFSFGPGHNGVSNAVEAGRG
jgi:hypothetical protein